MPQNGRCSGWRYLDGETSGIGSQEPNQRGGLHDSIHGECRLIGLGWMDGVANLPKIDDGARCPLHNECGA